jgi:hypothetical protein
MYLITFFGVIGFIGGEDSAKTAIAIYVVAFIIGLFAIRWGWKKFRYGGEVEDGTGRVDDTASPASKMVNIPGLKSAANVSNVLSIAGSFLRK